jgi:carbamoyltransferase
LERLESFPDAASVGLFYKSVTAFLGFKVNQQEGKVVCLAAQGDPKRFAGRLRSFLHVETQDGRLKIVSESAVLQLSQLSRRKVNFWRLFSSVPMALRAREWDALLNDLLRREFRECYGKALGFDGGSMSLSDAADVGAAAQQVFEEATLAIVRHCQHRFPCGNMAVAGGVFANVKVNGRILDLPGVESLYVHPGMGDEGLAFGAAALHANTERPERLVEGLGHVFLGPEYTDAAVRKALEISVARHVCVAEDVLIEKAAQALQAGLIVGLFRGASEYGPRALGHRSILANPANPEMHARLNERLRRPAFMPFTPAVLAECYDSIFTGPKHRGALPAARFMTIALDVDPAWRARIPAVVHTDGTARPQRLCADDDRFFYSLVKRFHETTGLGCVLNTSMNVHGDPLVNSPEDALEVLDRGVVDLLILGGHLVTAADAACRPE